MWPWVGVHCRCVLFVHVPSLCLTLWLPCDTVQVDDVPTTVFFTRFYMELSRLQHESRQAMLTLTGGGSALQPGTLVHFCLLFPIGSTTFTGIELMNDSRPWVLCCLVRLMAYVVRINPRSTHVRASPPMHCVCCFLPGLVRR